MAKLSVITLALNEERNIAECLSSVAWADECLVIDSGSTDGTVQVAKRHTDKVLTLAWHGYGGTKNEALRHATGEWILWLDADERVTPELAAEIQKVVHDDHDTYAAYDVARRAYFLGKWMRHSGWYPSRVTRLFRRGKGRFSTDSVHEHLILDGPVGNLRHDILHFTDPDLQHYFRKFNRYTSLAATDLYESGRKFSPADILLRPLFMFVKMFLLRRGFLDGMQGFILATVSSAYVFVKYAKLWELRHKTEKDT
jgi:glycosyltransferase involved in cell wall biosynthesis